METVQSISSATLPEGLLVSWLGDDFTGSAAVMEVLTFAGLPSILFLDLPTPEQLARFSSVRGIGIASVARTQNPDWMETRLPELYNRLSELGAPIVHYKVCTTLDSAPHIGSIGRAMEIGARDFDQRIVPVAIAAPQMRRYQCFGHLFASMAGEVYRIDRHPAMARHPITPISESDVIRHLSEQTNKMDFQLVNLESLGDPALSIDEHIVQSNRATALVFDCASAEQEEALGRLIWEAREHSRFVVGSQGIEYALVRHWQRTNTLAIHPDVSGIGRSKQLAVVSGSVSETTAKQIEWSRKNGFECIQFDPGILLRSEDDKQDRINAIITAALRAFSGKRDVLIYTALGPDDPCVKMLNDKLHSASADAATVNKELGSTLGKILYKLVNSANLKRAVISGGDTSGFATQELGVFALSALAPTIPGAAIFRAHAENSIDGLELALKGGQMGTEDYFGWIRDGGGQR